MLKIIALIAAVYGIFGLLLYVMQRDMMYFTTPEEGARDDAEVLWLESNSARLKVWKINQGSEAILYFGGNAESVGYNIGAFSRWFRGYSLYLANYRGYGGSSGSPSETALITDALALYDQIAPQHRKVHAIGRSLGSGVVMQLAAQRTLDRLILITPFDSLAAVASRHYPIFPVHWLIKDRYDSVAVAAGLKNPILLLIGGKDSIIPQQHALNLQKALRDADVTAKIIAAAGHNNILRFAESQQALSDFMQHTSKLPDGSD